LDTGKKGEAFDVHGLTVGPVTGLKEHLIAQNEPLQARKTEKEESFSTSRGASVQKRKIVSSGREPLRKEKSRSISSTKPEAIGEQRGQANLAGGQKGVCVPIENHKRKSRGKSSAKRSRRKSWRDFAERKRSRRNQKKTRR